MEQYFCIVDANDVLSVYSTDVEIPGEVHLAVVAAHKDERKVSTVLTKEDARRLRDQLNGFLGDF